MKLGICNELFEGWEFSRICHFCRELGYQGIELAPFTLPGYFAPSAPVSESPHLSANSRPTRLLTAAHRQSLRHTAESCGTEIIGLHWLLAQTSGLHVTSADRMVLRQTAEYLAELAELCRDLGGRVLVFGSPQQRSFSADQTEQDAWQNFRSVLDVLLPHLERHQVTFALEPLGPAETNFMQTAASARRLIDAFQSPWLRLHLDVKAMSSEALPLDTVICESAASLVHFHANDPNRLGPGMGQVAYEPIMAALQKINYDGYLSVEVFDYSPGAETIARKSVEYLQRQLKMMACID